MYKLSTSTPSTALVATPLSMDGHYTTLQPSRYHAFPCVFVLALPGAPKFFHSRRVEKHKLSIHCYSHNKGTLCWPHVHHVILLEPSMPGAKTDSGICCFHAFNLISIQSNPKHSCYHAPNAQTIQLPQNLPFTVSFHVSSFLSCHEPPKRPKDPFNRFSTSWGTPGSGNTTVAYTATATTRGHFAGLSASKWSGWSHHCLATKLLLGAAASTNSISYRSNAFMKPCFNDQTIQLPQNLLFIVSFHVSSFLNCHEPLKSAQRSYSPFFRVLEKPQGAETRTLHTLRQPQQR